MAHTLGFLWDVLLVSLGAYGGPEAHYGVFAKRMVDAKGYLSEDELYEYMAMTSLLPGPSSTQTLMAIGYHVGGAKLALLTLFVWALPIGTFLSLVAFLYTDARLPAWLLESTGALAPVAIGFVFYAALRMIKKGFKNPPLVIIGLISLLITLFLRSAWVFPVILFSSGTIYSVFNRSDSTTSPDALTPHLNYSLIATFISLVVFSFLTVAFSGPILAFFGHVLRFGFLVIGGGQVVIPYMVETLVDDLALLSLNDFLIGFGLVQGLPGPMFSFSAWAGGLAAPALSSPSVLASLLGMIGLFLPGAILILIMMPLWPALKTRAWAKPALAGILAAAAGLVLATGITLTVANELSWVNGLLIGTTFLLLVSQKIPAPLIVMLALIAGVWMG